MKNTLSFLKVCLYGCYINTSFYKILLFHQLAIVSHSKSENHFQTKLKHKFGTKMNKLLLKSMANFGMVKLYTLFQI